MEMNVEKKEGNNLKATIPSRNYGKIKNNCRLRNISDIWVE
jgi:hypothetical protein